MSYHQHSGDIVLLVAKHISGNENVNQRKFLIVNVHSNRTYHICTMQQDNSSDLEAVGSVLYDQAGVSPLQILKFSIKHDRYSSSQLHPMFICQVESDIKARKIVVEICDTIVKRGARLVGAGIVGILQKMEEDTKF